ncbi:Na+/H+ antiporter subunit E [Bhargavaea beijingensis]|uniref:Multisubunit sodium/proton antiporter, MrpE subunit n=1 Tax=Bhargavaea beijingensis TaxID=426756 RepID=A0A1G7F0M5_9BACL|nr:Na+/H+ antiporter subunit E [Bhargavaea beijingensis]MCW1927630.1 Na+/H+ antiporter subunit E [Bhargavaea beijingensis]RSK23979.1 Na+/H+ antiporter subunit E [Bhargavaea beijingensis]SDE69498.1 multisubunit sodium/proton antiporter, MrpE subunit [Bhargavaea beijingensis]
MAFQILLNFILAFTWMFILNSFSASTFIIGWLLGLLLILMMRRFFPGPIYVKRIWAILKLVLLFFKELWMANIQVFMLVIKPKLDIQPAIFRYPTKLKSDWEITLLSALITLTPGTIVMNVSEDKKMLYIHTLHIDDVDEAVKSIRDSFEKAIMEVSQP